MYYVPLQDSMGPGPALPGPQPPSPVYQPPLNPSPRGSPSCALLSPVCPPLLLLLLLLSCQIPSIPYELLLLLFLEQVNPVSSSPPPCQRPFQALPYSVSTTASGNFTNPMADAPQLQPTPLPPSRMAHATLSLPPVEDWDGFTLNQAGCLFQFHSRTAGCALNLKSQIYSASILSHFARLFLRRHSPLLTNSFPRG